MQTTLEESLHQILVSCPAQRHPKLHTRKTVKHIIWHKSENYQKHINSHSDTPYYKYEYQEYSDIKMLKWDLASKLSTFVGTSLPFDVRAIAKIKKR